MIGTTVVRNNGVVFFVWGQISNEIDAELLRNFRARRYISLCEI